MDLGSLWQFVVLAILLFLSSFFSASETALMSLSKIRIRHMVEEDIPGAKLVEKLISNPSKLLGAILIGNNAVNIGASALATSLAIKYYGQSRGVGIATIAMTIFVLIFGEITPKSLAAQNSEETSLKICKTINFIVIILSPIVTILTYITNFIIKLLGGKANINQPFITEEELKTIVDVSHEEGVLEVEEKEMIYNVFEFGDLQAKDVMVQRTDIVAIDKNTTYDEIIDIFKEEQFSRMPVYDEQIDNIIGILNVKDIMFIDKDKFKLSDYMREPVFTYEFKKITDLFRELRSMRAHMAIVLDEYGGTSGIVTMEDLIEEIVGDIEDEYDEEEEEIIVIKEDEYIVDGSTKINVVNDMIGVRIESEDFDSIGGFIIGELGRLPEQGETLQRDNIKFTVESIDKNRIQKVRIITGA
ncbi:putative hemolysin [Alkalithermobacter thermoalcaliphilus JW-YL-7 = DSM 7308]|uniref:Hemolysin n=1 Tax=Alkalithermobacter thermoalcaliphilus JW-YL-7 = DSM 7308 TaxID=1121328 RepID=A0A150FRN3_CLOPD|nr:putative signal transduction protein with CBS domain containing protein [[Clostridium] paradoxum JW-YL-7 = DSM 7308]SHK41493.1 putative hemolysin [[Clostridium] paradoxum JW-YL-7 = DSM 7308]